MITQFRHIKEFLPNGLRLVTVELPHLHTASVVAYAKVGSRYESPEDNGLSHFVEHMLFRGTKQYPSSYLLNLAIEQLGGTLYAETSRDYSLYQISLDPELVSAGIALFGEILGAPVFSQVEIEKEIVLEEINEDLDEDGVDINLDDLARREAFPDHPLGQKITGPIANVQRFGIADLKRHFARFYGAKNVVFCVSGPVAHAEVLAQVTAHLGNMPSGEPATCSPPSDMTCGPRFVYVENPGAQTATQLIFRALPETHPDFTALQALGRVLDDGMSTRLHYTLCDQMGLAYYVGACIEPFHDTALLEVSGAAAHAKFSALIKKTLDLVGMLRTQPVTELELAKAKRRYRYELASAFDDVDAMAGWFGGNELFFPPLEMEERIARMERVTCEDVLRVANTVLRPERLLLAVAGGLTDAQQDEAEKVLRDWR